MAPELNAEEIFFIVYFLLILICGLSCHILIALAFTLRPSIRRSTSNLIFISIAVADTCTLLWTVPISLVSRFYGHWPWNLTNDIDTGPTCKFSGALDNTVAVCSVWTLALYASDRLIYVMFPLKYHQKMNRKKALILMACIWFYSICLSLPPIFEYNSYKFSYSSYTCGIATIRHNYFLIFFIGAFPIPLLTICGCYICIYAIARENNRRVSHFCETLYDGSLTLINKAKSHIKSTAVVTAVIVCSLLCILPIFLSALHIYITNPDWKLMSEHEKFVYGILNKVAVVLFILNSTATTVIFMSCNKQLRQVIYGILHGHTGRRSEIKKLHRQQTTVRSTSVRDGDGRLRTLSSTRSALTASGTSSNVYIPGVKVK